MAKIDISRFFFVVAVSSLGLLAGCATSTSNGSAGESTTTTLAPTTSSPPTTSTTAATEPETSRDFVLSEINLSTYTGSQAILFADANTQLELSLEGPIFSRTEMQLFDLQSTELLAEAAPTRLPDISALTYVTTTDRPLLITGAHPDDLDQSMTLNVYSGPGLRRIVVPVSYSPIFAADVEPSVEMVLDIEAEGILTLERSRTGGYDFELTGAGGTYKLAQGEMPLREPIVIPLLAGEYVLRFDPYLYTSTINLSGYFLNERGVVDMDQVTTSVDHRLPTELIHT